MDKIGNALYPQLFLSMQDRKNLIQQFHDYQVDWLKSHNDITFEPELETLIIHFLHDTANCFMMNMGEEE